ncbi:hypothetical protein MMC07_001636 [Pseudocyphellaria aurata]|nr:hypothetical protein [Pseudocyphellaria aurata]
MPTKPSQRAQSLATAEFKHYLKYAALLSYYKEIKEAGSVESSVDNLWNNLLMIVFSVIDNFGIEQESRVLKNQGVSLRADFVIRYIRYIKNGDPKKVILLGAAEATSGTVWADALQQVTNYAKLVQIEAGQDPNATLYLLVNVGTYVRFHQLNAGADVAIDWAPAQRNLLELADDEERIWQHLQQVRDIVV